MSACIQEFGLRVASAIISHPDYGKVSNPYPPEFLQWLLLSMEKNLRVIHDQISLGQLTRVADIVSLSLKMFLKLKKNFNGNRFHKTIWIFGL